MQPLIYLDNNATTPLDPIVLEAMLPYMTSYYANASSSHAFGKMVNIAVQNARQKVADLIGAEKQEIIFTSGATEAINLAIKGITEAYPQKGYHIVTVATEHYAVLDVCNYLEKRGWEVTYLAVQEDGLIDLDVLKESLRPDTVLISVMYANNETGVIQPISQIAQLAHEAGAFFMTDATQALGKIPINVDELDVDLLVLSAHKFYGPKGVGALYVRNNLKLEAIIHGGGHEKGMRSGTLNVPGIVGLGKASELATELLSTDSERISILRNTLEKELLSIPDSFVNGNTTFRLPNTTNITFPGSDSSAVIANLQTIALSNGSACTSAIIEPSHVLKFMGLTNENAFSSLRFSLGRFTTKNQINCAVAEIKCVVTRLRQAIGLPVKAQ